MPNPRRPGLHAAPNLCRRIAPLLLAAAGVCGAQTATTGALLGRLPTAQPAVLRNGQTGQATPVQPARDGSFLLPALPPGDYELSGPALPGVAVVILPGQTTQFPAQTPVTAPTPPGITPDQDDDGLQSAYSLPSTQNSVLVDGVSALNSFHATPVGSGADPAPDPEADSDSAELSTGPAHGQARGRHAGAQYAFSSASVREFRTTSATTSAADSGAPATVTLLTRSGSRQLHGSARFVLRSQLLAATNPFSLVTTYTNGVSTTVPVKPHDLRENVVATLGGPIPHTPLLFFYAFDLRRRGFPAISSPANPAFYTLTATQTALLRTRGVSSAATEAGLAYLASLTGPTGRRADQTIHFARVDWHPGAMALGLGYNRLRWNNPAGLTEAPVVAAARNSLGTSSGSADALLLRVARDGNPRRTWQVQAQLARDRQYESPQTPLPQEPAIGPGGLAPEVVIGPNGLRFGTPAYLSRQAYPDERRLDVAAATALVAGRHLFQFGGQFSAVDDRTSTLANSAGTFRYDSTRTVANAGGLVDFLTDLRFNVNAYPNGGCPSISAAVHLFCFSSFTQSFGQSGVTFSTQSYAGYAEDTWRLAARLTLQAGLRYDYLLLPVPATPNRALDAVFSSRGRTAVFPEDRNNLGPHVALSAEPFGAGRLTVHLGYAMVYGRLPGATLAAALADTALPGSTTRLRLTPSVVTTCPQVPSNGFGYPCSFLAEPTGVASTTGSAVLLDRRFRLPDVQQMTMELSRPVGTHVSISAAYLLSLARQLPSTTDLNIAPSTARASFQLAGGPSSGLLFAVPLYTARVDPSFGPVTDVQSNVNSTYNALFLTAHAHFGSRLTADARYSFSKALDTAAALTGIPRTDAQFDPFTNGYDKGLSSLNFPQFLRFDAVATSSASARPLLRRWELAPIVLARSGRPYSYELFGGTRLPGGHLSLNGSGGALYLPTVGRNTLRLPAAVQADLRLARTFSPAAHPFGAPLLVRVAAEAYNLTNRLNLSSVEERAYLVGTPADGVTPLVYQSAAAIASEGLNTQPFGTPTAASSSLQRERQVEFSVQIAF